MREPQHPVKPAFDQSHDDRESWRQQELAKLSGQQREQYQQLIQNQQAELEAKTQELQKGRQDQIARSMRKHLSPLGQPRLEMSGPHNSPHLHDLKRAQGSVKDHLEGNETPETQRYARILHGAHSKAEKEVAYEQAHTLQNQELKQQNDKDRFLRNIEKERGREDKTEQLRETAKDITQRGATGRFNEAADEKAWQQALEKAAEREADRGLEKEHDLTNNSEHRR